MIHCLGVPYYPAGGPCCCILEEKQKLGKKNIHINHFCSTKGSRPHPDSKCVSFYQYFEQNSHLLNLSSFTQNTKKNPLHHHSTHTPHPDTNPGKFNKPKLDNQRTQPPHDRPTDHFHNQETASKGSIEVISIRATTAITGASFDAASFRGEETVTTAPFFGVWEGWGLKPKKGGFQPGFLALLLLITNARRWVCLCVYVILLSKYGAWLVVIYVGSTPHLASKCITVQAVA